MTNNIVYLDNAASTFPKPGCVISAVENCLRNNTSNPGRSGHFLSENAAELVFNARCNIAEYFGLANSPESVIFTSNATQAINIVLFGILANGGHALISDMEHNSVLRPLAEMKRKGQCDFDIVDTTGNDIVSAFENKIRKDTKIVFITHASNVTGETLSIEDIGAMCKRRNILFGIDASQTAGHIRYDLSKMHVDFLCAAGHKGLFGPQGTGVLINKSNIVLRPLIFGGTGTQSMSERQPDIMPESLESGTLNTPGICGLSAGIDYLKKFGKEIAEQENFVADKIRTSLADMKKITTYTPQSRCSGIVAFNVNGYHSETVTEILSKNGICVRGGYHCSKLMHMRLGTEGSGVVRISVSGFNSAYDAARIIECLNKM